MITLPNKARPANPAMTSLFHAGCKWRGVADARRWAMNPRVFIGMALATTVVLAGCQSSRDSEGGGWHPLGESVTELATNQNAEIRFSHGWERIELSKTKPVDTKNGISLVRVNQDGEVFIDVRSTGEQLHAYPGKPFLGAYQELEPGLRVRTFGECGLQVVSSDPKVQSAILERAIVAHSYRIKK